MSEVEFEAGQRWMVDDRPVGTIIAGRANAEHWADTDKNWWSESYLHHLGVLDAPAPKPRQRWQNDPCADVQIVDADGDLSVERLDTGDALFRGTVVDVAKWLADRNYRHVSDVRTCSDVREPDISPMTLLASAVAEVFAVPTPEQSRRYVDIAIRSIRNEPFAKAIGYVLMAMPERCTKSGISPHEIMATIDACRAWEYARGQVAPGKRALSDMNMAQLTEVATLAAWTRVRARDATGIGAIVAEFYERARATC